MALGLTQPHIQWIPRTLLPRVKRREREADHSPPSSAEVKTAWRYISTPVRLHSVVLVKYKDKFFVYLFSVVLAIIEDDCRS
jgi:hypothetical protein